MKLNYFFGLVSFIVGVVLIISTATTQAYTGLGLVLLALLLTWQRTASGVVAEFRDHPAKSSVEIGVVQAPNPEVRSYHFETSISLNQICRFDFPLREYNDKDFIEIGEVGTAIVKGISGVNGIESVSITPYSIQLMKALMFSWEDLHPQVLEVLKNELNAFGPVEVSNIGGKILTRPMVDIFQNDPDNWSALLDDDDE